MSNITFGKTDWSDPVPDASSFSSSGEGKKTEYMKLPPGTHTVRLITDPYNYVFFKVKLDSDPEVVGKNAFYGDKIKASLPLNTNPLIVNHNLKPKQGYYAGVIDRKTGATYVLDMPQQVRTGLQTWRSKKGYGDLKSFDFDIVANPKSKNSYYTVLPSIPEALSEDDLKKKAEFDEKQLERLAQPVSDHALQMKWLNEKRERNGMQAISSEIASSTSTPAKPAVAADDSDNEGFEPADAASMS
jgi:hypothetical protein